MVAADTVQLYCRGMRIAEKNVCQHCGTVLYNWSMPENFVPPKPRKKEQMRLF